MLKHFTVLSSAFVLLVGAWAVMYFHQKSRRFPESRLRDLFRFLLFYILFELESFVFVYFDNNLTTPQWERLASWFKIVHWILATLLALGLYHFLFRTIAWLRDKKLPRGMLPALAIYTAVLMGLTLLSMRFPGFLPESPLLTFWNLYIWPMNLLAAVWLIKLLAENRRGTDPGRLRAHRAFAWLFLGRIAVQLGVVFLSLGPVLFWKIAVVRLFVVYTNLVPVFWLRFYFVPWAGSLGKIISGRVDMPSLQIRHGLSARELEILNLMIDGKSYREIEEALHISIHTVKSHVYSLYRKMKVRNRHQLIHLISTSQLENT